MDEKIERILGNTGNRHKSSKNHKNGIVKEANKQVGHRDVEKRNRKQIDSITRLYKLYKNNIEEISWYDNTEEARLLARGRTNTLNLKWREKFKNQDTTCPTCRRSEENLEHFLLFCGTYSEIRTEYEFLAQPYIENSSELIANILLFRKSSEKEINERKKLLKRLWRKRSQVMKATQHPN